MTSQSPYIFICGCPRSGTTAFTRVISNLDGLVLGMERFKRLASKDRINELGPGLFTRERFFDFSDGLTNLTPANFEPWKRYYARLEQKSGNGQLQWGDKLPGYFRFYRELAQRFENVRFIFLLRDFDPVASSFQKRFEDPDDPWDRPAEAALETWNRALRLTADYLDSKIHQPLLVCDHEAFFSGHEGAAKRVLDFLGWEKTPLFLKRYQAAQKRHGELTRQRQQGVDPKILARLQRSANLDLARQLKAQAS